LKQKRLAKSPKTHQTEGPSTGAGRPWVLCPTPGVGQSFFHVLSMVDFNTPTPEEALLTPDELVTEVSKILATELPKEHRFFLLTCNMANRTQECNTNCEDALLLMSLRSFARQLEIEIEKKKEKK